jgi:hypothetical protein
MILSEKSATFRDHASRARLASGWPARPLPGGSRTLWIATRGFSSYRRSSPPPALLTYRIPRQRRRLPGCQNALTSCTWRSGFNRFDNAQGFHFIRARRSRRIRGKENHFA